MQIEIDIRSFWRAGTGAGETGGIDALCATDRDGLPYLPGKHLKGLLRDAVDRVLALGQVKGIDIDAMFGQAGFSPGEDDRPPVPYSRAKPGCLRIDSAHLCETDRREILGAANKQELIKQLFRTLQATAIDCRTGAAKNKSLRMEQVVVPLKLIFEVSASSAAPARWEVAITTALPLIRTLGQKRTRGLGRATLTRVDV